MLGAAPAEPEPARHRPARHRPVGPARLQGPAVLHRRHRDDALPAARRGLRQPAQPHLPPGRRQLRPRVRPVRHGQRRPRPGRGHRPRCSSGRSTSTATPTAPTSRSPSSRSSRSCCARWCSTRRTKRATWTRWYVTTVHDGPDRLRGGLHARAWRATPRPEAVRGNGSGSSPRRCAPTRSTGRCRGVDATLVPTTVGIRAAGGPGQRRRLRLRRLPLAGRGRPGLPRAPRHHAAAAAVGRGLRLRRQRLLRAGQDLLRRHVLRRRAAPTTRSCSTCRRLAGRSVAQQLAASIKALPANTFAPFTHGRVDPDEPVHRGLHRPAWTGRRRPIRPTQRSSRASRWTRRTCRCWS